MSNRNQTPPQGSYPGYPSPTPPRGRVITPTGGPSRTKQSMAEACDVNAIMRKYRATGEIPNLRNPEDARYGEFANVDDYHVALNRVRIAEERFASLPSHIRKACGHDPAELVRMTTDPEGYRRLQELGISEAAPEPEAFFEEASPGNVEPQGTNPKASED